jgi:hypothetical protein
VTIGGWLPFCPWVGGSSETTPDFCDINSDGDFDIFVGNFVGKITYYENQGEYSDANFKFITHEFAGVDLGGNTYAGRTSPEFCDLDGDEDLDLLMTNIWQQDYGNLRFYRNNGSPQNALMVFETNLFLPGYHIPTASPSVIDIDNDGDYDLFVGNQYGGIMFFRNWGDSVGVDNATFNLLPLTLNVIPIRSILQ